MATIAYDLFDGDGDLNGRVTPSGHTWVGVIPNDGNSQRMATSGGRLTTGAIPGGADLKTAERAYIDVPFAWGMSVEYGVYWPTDGTYSNNQIMTGLVAPSRIPLGVFDANPFSSRTNDRDGSLGRIHTSRSYFDTDPGAGGEHWVVKADQLLYGFDYLTNTLPPMDSIGVPSGLNKIRVTYIEPATGGVLVFLNNIQIAVSLGYGLLPEDNNLSLHRFLVQLSGAGSTIDYIAIYEGTGAWDGSTGGGGGGGGETTTGWWTNLRYAKQEN